MILSACQRSKGVLLLHGRQSPLRPAPWTATPSPVARLSSFPSPRLRDSEWPKKVGTLTVVAVRRMAGSSIFPVSHTIFISFFGVVISRNIYLRKAIRMRSDRDTHWFAWSCTELVLPRACPARLPSPLMVEASLGTVAASPPRHPYLSLKTAWYVDTTTRRIFRVVKGFESEQPSVW